MEFEEVNGVLPSVEGSMKPGELHRSFPSNSCYSRAVPRGRCVLSQL